MGHIASDKKQKGHVRKNKTTYLFGPRITRQRLLPPSLISQDAIAVNSERRGIVVCHLLLNFVASGVADARHGSKKLYPYNIL